MSKTSKYSIIHPIRHGNDGWAGVEILKESHSIEDLKSIKIEHSISSSTSFKDGKILISSNDLCENDFPIYIGKSNPNGGYKAIYKFDTKDWTWDHL